MYKYFKDSEVACQHCGKQGMDEEFMRKIEQLRETLGFPFVVTSAYRCSEHPIEASKKTVGPHQQGKAMDIRVSRERAYRLLQAALGAGFTGIGVQQKGNVRYLHLDTCDGDMRPTIWSY